MGDRYHIQLSKRVAGDLEAIFAHVARDSPANAARMIERILTAIERLKILPHRNVVEGQSRRLKHPVRSMPVQSYVVYFRVMDQQQVVRILQVRHGARRRPKRFE